MAKIRCIDDNQQYKTLDYDNMLAWVDDPTVASAHAFLMDALKDTAPPRRTQLLSGLKKLLVQEFFSDTFFVCECGTTILMTTAKLLADDGLVCNACHLNTKDRYVHYNFKTMAVGDTRFWPYNPRIQRAVVATNSRTKHSTRKTASTIRLKSRRFTDAEGMLMVAVTRIA